MAMQQVGLIGAGIMGIGILGRVLAAGYRVRVFDTNPATVASCVQMGAEGASSPAEAARGSAFVQAVLPGPPETEAAVFGPDGVASGIESGAIFINHATVDPAYVTSVADRLLDQGVETVDAPMLRGQAQARDGTLGMPVGANPGVYEKVEHLIEQISELRFMTGGVGTGSALKLVNNMLNCTILCASTEAVVLGTKSGLKLETMLEAFYMTPARAAHFELMPQTFTKRNFEPGFMTKLGAKDIRLALKHATDLDVPIGVTAAAQSVLKYGAIRYGEENYPAIVKLYEEAAGVTVKAEGDKLFPNKPEVGV